MTDHDTGIAAGATTEGIVDFIAGLGSKDLDRRVQQRKTAQNFSSIGALPMSV